jgi:4-amino-4-deoxy-L-arabinose transferase-like glycosyltransferase
MALLLIIAGGTALRLYKLSTQPYWMDEGYTINAVLSILEKGSSTLDSGENYFCATYCYPTAYIAKLFGNNAFSYRLFSVIAGIIFILIIFIIVRSLFNIRIALLSSFFVSFSYWQIAWSRQARWYTLFAIFFWLSLYFFYKSLNGEKKKLLFYCLAILFTILSTLTHGLG